MYVRHLQRLSQPCTVNMHHDIAKRLDLVVTFRGLTIVTFTDKNPQPQLGTEAQAEARPFYYPGLLPSPSITGEKVSL